MKFLKRLFLSALIFLSVGNATLQKFSDGESWYSVTRNDGISITRNRVGVLTTTPQYTLDVRGTINATAFIGNFTTANNSLTANYALLASTANFANLVTTASYATTAGYTTLAITANFCSTANFSITANYANLSSTANYLLSYPAYIVTNNYTGTITINGNVSANFYYGNGSNLAGITATVTGSATLTNVTINGTLFVSGNFTSNLSYMRRTNGITTGSVNTSVVRYISANVSVGNDITYVASSTAGDSFTINTSGLYCVSVEIVNGSLAGYVQIRTGASVDNNVDDVNARSSMTLASSNGGGSISYTDFFSASSKIWVFCQRVPGNFPFINGITIVRIR